MSTTGYLLVSRWLAPRLQNFDNVTVKEAAEHIAKLEGLGDTETAADLKRHLNEATFSGDCRAGLIAGSILTMVYVSFGFTTEIWHLAIVMTLCGMATGVTVTTSQPLTARYTKAFYKKAKARANAVPVRIMCLGLCAAQPLVVYIYLHFGMKYAWYAAGTAQLGFTLLTAVVSKMIGNRCTALAQRDTVVMNQEVEAICSCVRELLTKHHSEHLQKRGSAELINHLLAAMVVPEAAQDLAIGPGSLHAGLRRTPSHPSQDRVERVLQVDFVPVVGCGVYSALFVHAGLERCGRLLPFTPLA